MKIEEGMVLNFLQNITRCPMKKLLLAAFFALVTLSTASLRSETGYETALKQVQAQTSTNDCESDLSQYFTVSDKHKDESSSGCDSKCQLSCLQSKKCSLFFNITAANLSENTYAAGQTFTIQIIAPNGQVVGNSITVDASTLSTDPTNPNNFQIQVNPPICAGNYVVYMTNDSVTNADLPPFFTITVTNSCNSNTVSVPVPLSYLEFTDAVEIGLNLFPVGTATEVEVPILKSFVHFKKCG